MKSLPPQQMPDVRYVKHAVENEYVACITKSDSDVI